MSDTKNIASNPTPAQEVSVPEWEPKLEWWLPGDGFLVVVKHHIARYDDGGGVNRWNVYAYIYPKHWHFRAFSGESLFQAAACDLPLHSGPSLCRIHRGETGITAYQVGSDYAHIWDERYQRQDPEDMFPNGRVFLDARDLFVWLSAPLSQATEAAQ